MLCACRDVFLPQCACAFFCHTADDPRISAGWNQPDGLRRHASVGVDLCFRWFAVNFRASREKVGETKEDVLMVARTRDFAGCWLCIGQML